MYGEFTGDYKQESVESLKYQGMNLDGFSGKYVLGILISDGNLETKFDLTDFINTFEKEYEDVLADWKGFMMIFDHKWIVTQLLDSIGYYSNLPFVVSVQKPEKQQYRKVVDFLRLVRDRDGEFLIGKVLPGLQKFLNTSEAYVLDIMMMMKKDGVISNSSIEDYISHDSGKLISETISSGVIFDEATEETETRDSYVSESPDDEAPKTRLTVNDDGSYSFRIEISLDVIMRHSGDSWLKEIIRDAIELEIGKQVEINNPQYIPIECDSENGTIWISVNFFDESKA